MSDEDALEKMGKGSITVLLGFVLGTLFQYLYKMVLARFLGPEQFGVFIQGLAITYSVGTIALLGLQITAPRYISYYSGKEKLNDITQTVSTASLIALFSSIIASAAMFFSSEFLALVIFSEPALVAPLKVFSIAIPFFVFISLTLSLFRGQEEAFYKTVIDDFVWSGSVLVLISIAAVYSHNIVNVTYAYLAATAISALISILIYSRRYEYSLTLSRTKIKKLLLFSWPLFIISLFGVLNRWFDVLMLGWIGASSEAGIYDVAFSLAGYVALLLEIVGFMFLPVISNFHAKGKKSRIRELYRTATRWMITASVPIVAAALIFPRELIQILFGSEYISASLPLSILAIGFFYKVLKGPSEVTLISMGKNRKLLVGKSIIAFLIVSLNLLLIPFYGIVGAAVSTLIAYLVGDSTILWFARDELESLPHDIGFLKIIMAGLAASIPTAVVNSYLNPGLMVSVLLGVILTIVYLLLLTQGGILHEEDLDLFRDMLYRRLD